VKTWRDVMPAVRALAWSSRERGECEILQRGEVLDGSVGVEDVKGPIRIRRVERVVGGEDRKG
jgi:hypothetical protein